MAFDAFVSYSHAADGRLAPALQRAIQRLAKPWYRARALRVFRDESALSANPHLWSSIQSALDESEWFVLLASPEAVASEWVGREIGHWLSSKSADRVLVVVTDGTWEWDSDAHALTGSAVPAAMRDAFVDEPRHVDVRWADSETDLDMHNARFRDVVAQLAAPMHGIGKDDLDSEDVRQYRRARRLARGGVSVLALLVVISLVTTTFALRERNRVQQRNRALVAQELLTDRQRLAGVVRQLVSESKRSVASGASARAALLAAQAAGMAARTSGLVSHNDVDSSLIESLQANPKMRTTLNGLSGAIVDVDVSPDGRRAAAVSHSGRVGVWRLSDARLLTTFAGPPVAAHLTFMDSGLLAVMGENAVAGYRASGDGASWTRAWTKPVSGAAVMAGAPSAVFVLTASSGPNDLGPSSVHVIGSSGREIATVHLAGVADAIAVAPDGAHFAVPNYPLEFLPDPFTGQPALSATNVHVTVDVYAPTGALTARFNEPGDVQAFPGIPPIMRFSRDGTKVALVVSDALVMHTFDIATGADHIESVPTEDTSQAEAGVSWRPIAISSALDRVVERHGGVGTSEPPADRLGVASISTHTFSGDLQAPGAPSSLVGAGRAAFLPDGSRFVAAGEADAISVFAVAEETSRIATLTNEGPGSVSAIAPDASLVVTVGSMMRVRPRAPSGRRVDVPVGAPDFGAVELAFGRTSDAVAILFSDGSLEVRSTRDGKLLLRMESPSSCGESCAVPPLVSFSGTLAAGRVAVASEKRTRTWDLRDGKVVGQHDVSTTDMGTVGVALATSGTRLVTTTFNFSGASKVQPFVRVYDWTPRGWVGSRSFPAVAETLGVLPCPCFAVSHGGRRAIESAISGMTMWDLDTGKKVWSRPAASGPLWFSRDDSVVYHTVVSGDLDVVSAADGTTRYTLKVIGPPNQTPRSIVDDRGHLLVSTEARRQGVSSTELTDWALGSADLVAAACREANRNLSTAEWTQYVGSFDPYEQTCPNLPAGT